jgi:prefoldin subunit 5
MAEVAKQYLHNNRALLGNGGRNALATILFVVTGFAAGLSVLLLLEEQDTQTFYEKLALTLLLSSCSIGAMRWRASFMEYTDARPDPESWRLAKALIKQHSIPFWPLIIALSVACMLLITISVVAVFAFLNTESRLVMLPWIVGIFIGCVLFFLIAMRAVRRLVRKFYPDKPYVWSTPRGIAVSDKAFVDWPKVEQIDTRWELRSGAQFYATGAVIWTDVARENGKIIVPLMNATIDVNDAVSMMRQMAMDHGFALPDQAPPNARPVKPPSERDWKRAYDKSPELRKMLLDRIESLGKSIQQVEQELEDLSTKAAGYESRIVESRCRKSMISAKLRQISQSGALTSEFEDAMRNASKSFDDSISSYEQQILEIPLTKQTLDESLSKLRADLADCEEKRRRYLG